MVDYQIYGVHTRDAMITATAARLSLSADNIHYDDRPHGGMMAYTAKKAWTASAAPGITHRVALADDVQICDDFRDICEQIAAAHPDDIVSLFPFDFMQRIPEIEGHDTPYIEAHILSGCATLMPLRYVEPCFEYVWEQFRDDCPDDAAIQAWAQHAGKRILTTIPATVQHIGDDSIANPNAPIRRTVYFEQKPEANWSGKQIIRYQQKEWFFRNHGKRPQPKEVLQIVE